MGTGVAKYVVEVTEASVCHDDSEVTYRTTFACTCGWTGTAGGDTSARAIQGAATARIDHLLEAHPKQAPSTFFRPKARARYVHARAISAAVEESNRFRREAACACGWTGSARGRTADRAGQDARALHRAHLHLETGASPARDYIVLVGLVVVIGVLMVAMAVVAIQASGGDPSSFTGS